MCVKITHTRHAAVGLTSPLEFILFRTLYRTELELVASKATVEFIENEIKQLETLKSTKQKQLETLYEKYRQIQDFEKLLVSLLNAGTMMSPWVSPGRPNLKRQTVFVFIVY